MCKTVDHNGIDTTIPVIDRPALFALYRTVRVLLFFRRGDPRDEALHVTVTVRAADPPPDGTTRCGTRHEARRSS